MEDLTKYTTRKLLAMRQFTRARGYETAAELAVLTIAWDVLRAELATREHVLNKVEAKAMRKQRAKTQKNKPRLTPKPPR